MWREGARGDGGGVEEPHLNVYKAHKLLGLTPHKLLKILFSSPPFFLILQKFNFTLNL
jgi:hypothetical protein